ncbi:MAG TPA: transglutaminase family protein [Nocardia sp.]|uniref:transglutaminase family protein n=1 Tax=Nocardia TaxID=1817 RepID=UPI0024589850|nr:MULTISPECIES: transglutaminase family protein [Nocardia]HLS77056.1 transglutaminase family protein [Nocardia sp.]
MSRRLRVAHTTGFTYESAVTGSFNEARLTPRSDARQNVIVNRVDTVPPTRPFRYTDYWGTAVTAFDVSAPHDALEVSSYSVVETEPAASAPQQGCDWARLRSEHTLDTFAELLEATGYVPEHEELRATAAELAAGADPARAVSRAAEWVHETMTYVPGSTSVHTSAVQAWSDRAGVCQDYAHLTLLLLRAMGIPCRYVSGYLHPDPDAAIGEAVAGESHAWIEAWTGRWWGYDPTNATAIGEQHVSVAVGRDYADVPPLKGIFSGGRSIDHKVLVEVTRLA